MGTVSLWTRPPALHLCAGPKKIHPATHQTSAPRPCRWAATAEKPQFSRHAKRACQQPCPSTDSDPTSTTSRDIDHQSLHTKAHATTCPDHQELQLWELGCLLHDCTRELDWHNKDIDNLVHVQQLESLWRTRGICICATTGMSTTWPKHSTSCNCGISTVSHNSARICWTCTTHIDHLVNVLQENLSGFVNRTMGICLCATTGNNRRPTMDCNCGDSTVSAVLSKNQASVD